MLALAVVTDFLYDGLIVWLGPAVLGVLLVVFWFGRPLMRD